MTLDDLLTVFRSQADDRVAPYLLDDAAATVYANEAVLEACERAPLLFDEASAFCSIAVVAGTAGYALDASVRVVDRIRLDSTGEPLPQASEEELTRRYGVTWQLSEGVPTAFVRHKQTIRLFPVPDAGDTLKLAVYRRPLPAEKMALASRATATPAIPEQYHMPLVHWLLYRFYSMRDVDIAANAPRAQSSLAAFDAAFGTRKSARFEQITRDFPAGGSLPVVGVR